MDVKVFELVIDLEDESGVSAIALVDFPATARNFEKFSKQPKYKFKVHDEEKRIVSGYFMVADLPIVREDDEHGEHYVVFRKETIEQIVDKFMRNGLNSSVNLMHDPSKTVDATFLIESIIVDEARGTFAPESFEAAPDGSWWGSMRVLDEDVWQSVLDGTFRGFSIEGGFSKSEPVLQDEEIIEETIKELEAEFRKNLTSMKPKYINNEQYILQCKRFLNMNKEEQKTVIKSNLERIKEWFNSDATEVVEVKEEATEVAKSKFEDVTTKDGLVLSIEPAVEVGAAVAVMGEDGAEPAADGEYTLADDTVIIVAGGVITEIPSAEEEEEVVEEEVEEEMSNDPEVKQSPKVVIERQEIETKFSELKAEFEAKLNTLTEEFTAYKEENEKFNTVTADAITKFAKEPSAEPTVKPSINRFGKSTNAFEDGLKNIKKLNRNFK